MTPTERPELPLHVDSTMLTCFRSCPRKFYHEFVLGLRPLAKSIDLHAGGCFALALETTYKGIHNGLSLADSLDRARAAFFIEWGDFEIPPYKTTAKTPDRVWEAVEAYFTQYNPFTDEIQAYLDSSGKPTLEYTFAIPLEPLGGCYDESFPEHPSGDPFLYCGRIDLLGRKGGRTVIRDEKTSGKSAGANWSESWDLRSQFIGYTWACREGGIDTETVVVRGVGILKTKFDFPEAEKVYSNFMRARWLEQLRRDLWRLRRSWDEGYFDYNLGDSCTNYGNCAYMPLCTVPEDHVASWMGEYRVQHWNPLIKNPIKEPAA